MRLRPSLQALVIGATIVAVGAGCSSSKKSTSVTSTTTTAAASATTGAPATTAAAAAKDTVTISNFAFSPDPITVAAGATVTVHNKDDTTHTVTSTDKTSFDTKHVGSGATVTFVAPAKPGSYKYHCSIHQFMTGTLVVQ